MAQSSCSRLKQPNALFEFKVTSGEVCYYNLFHKQELYFILKPKK